MVSPRPRGGPPRIPAIKGGRLWVPLCQLRRLHRVALVSNTQAHAAANTPRAIAFYRRRTKQLILSPERAQEFYQHHEFKSFFASLMRFMTSGAPSRLGCPNVQHGKRWCVLPRKGPRVQSDYPTSKPIIAAQGSGTHD